MRLTGLLLLIVGVAVAAYGLMMDTSVEYAGRSVHNLAMAQDRQLVFLGGCAVAIMAVVLIAAGQLVTTRARTDHASPSTAPRDPIFAVAGVAVVALLVMGGAFVFAERPIPVRSAPPATAASEASADFVVSDLNVTDASADR